MEWFDHQGLLDSSPAVAFLTDLIAGGEIRRNFAFNAVDVNSGDYEVFTQDNTTFEEIPTAAFASGSIPTVFPPQYLHGFILMDGGTVWNINVDTAI